MAFSLDLPDPLSSEGWKVKIRDKERLEPPHVTIFHGRRVWRLGLRDRMFLIPPGGNWNQIDQRVRTAIESEATWRRLCDAWDRMYPPNPISAVGDDHD